MVVKWAAPMGFLMAVYWAESSVERLASVWAAPMGFLMAVYWAESSVERLASVWVALKGNERDLQRAELTVTPKAIHSDENSVQK